MANTELSTVVDIKKVAKENIEFHIQYKNLGWFRLGLWLLKLGCWVGGFGLVDEIPISLLDENGKEITRG